MQSIIQVFKVNEVRSGEKNGRRWEMQDAECALLSPEGLIEEVGVLLLPKEHTNKTAPGLYLGTFALRADKSREGGRQIRAVLVGLQPYAIKHPKVTA